MRQDFFTFTPTVQALHRRQPPPRAERRRRSDPAPHAPRARSTSRSRANDRDLELPDKLKAEWPGILAWMIDGLPRRGRRTGSTRPSAVRAATDKYLAAEDTFERWRDDCTTPDPNAWESSADLWHSWKRWAESRRRVRRHSEAVQPDPRGTRLHCSQRRHEGKPTRLPRRSPDPPGLHRGPTLWRLGFLPFGTHGPRLPHSPVTRARCARGRWIEGNAVHASHRRDSAASRTTTEGVR